MADKKEQAIATERGLRCDNPDCGFQIELDSSYVAELRRYPEREAEWGKRAGLLSMQNRALADRAAALKRLKTTP